MNPFKITSSDFEVEHLSSHDQKVLAESVKDYNMYVENVLRTIMSFKSYTEMTNCFPTEKLIKKGA